MKCKKHPKYKAVYKPRTGCWECWDLYREKHPEEKVFYSSMDIPLYYIEEGRWDILQTGLRRLMNEVNYFNNKFNTTCTFQRAKVEIIKPADVERLSVSFAFNYEEKE